MPAPRFKDAASRLRALRFLKPHCERHGVEGTTRDELIYLAAMLARELDPPRKRKPPGAKRKWEAKVLMELVEKLRALKDQDVRGRKRGVSGACRLLAKEEPWTSILGGTAESRAAALRDVYHRQTAGLDQEIDAVNRKDWEALRAIRAKYRTARRGMTDGADVWQNSETGEIFIKHKYVPYKG